MLYTSAINKIKQDSKRRFADAVMQFGNEATKVITENRQWEGFSDVRDIVDTGYLRKSLDIETRDKGDSFVGYLTWGAEYAAAIHEGATIRYSNGNVRRIPPRPWTELAAKRFNIEDYYG